jgi:NitT/TauT family transport system permease protein
VRSLATTAAISPGRPAGGGVRRIVKSLAGIRARRGVAALALFFLLWQVAVSLKGWLGIEVPWVGRLPSPTSVFAAWLGLLGDPGYWQSWYLSFTRVMTGFLAAMLVGIPVGLGVAVNRYFYDVFYPGFEILRPIPPLAWVPISLIFWPTQEMSIASVTFLGAFYTIVINVIGGARSIDARYLRAARSMGATRWHLFWKVVLPATLPSIFTGAAVGMGITWEVVVAAEMISTGGRASGGGLGFFIWNSYIGGSLQQIVVGMISIGIAGYLSSALIRMLGYALMPWQRVR